MKKILVATSMLFLVGCSIHVVKLGDPHVNYTPTAKSDIAVYYNTMPDCKYKEIALIDNPIDSWESNLEKSLDVLKTKAAEQGAHFISFKNWSKSGFNDKHVGHVVAYRCDNK